jgi:hypothetical protein
MRFAPLAAIATCVAGALFTNILVASVGLAQAPGVSAPAALRPPADILLDCAKAPKDAVTRLQPDLAVWATVYCTRNGAIFNANEKYFGAFPDSGQRASFYAGEMDGKSGAAGAGSYFKSIAYAPMTDAAVQDLLKIDPIVSKIVAGKKLYRLDLISDGGNMLSLIAIEPSADPFWVFPLTDKGLGTPAFFVIGVATMNRNRR